MLVGKTTIIILLLRFNFLNKANVMVLPEYLCDLIQSSVIYNFQYFFM